MKPSDYDELLTLLLNNSTDDETYELLKNYITKLKNIEVTKIAYKIRNEIIEIPFSVIPPMCRHNEFGIDTMTHEASYTCRHPQVVPPGDAWVDCNLKTCPMLKKYCTQSKD